MTGANYTGGKRNVARTRFRDSARRAQKNHFGRRRLGILSRGLTNATHHVSEEETTSGISSILLEHAQREISRPSRSSPVHQTGLRRASAHDPPSSNELSTSGPNVARAHLSLPRTVDYESYPSLRGEVNRILEFSRTVGLCNYSFSPSQDVPASLASRVDSEPRRFDPLQQRNNGPSSSTSGLSGTQHAETFTDYAVQDSETLQFSQTGTSRSKSLSEASPQSEQAREGETDLVYTEPISNYRYPEHRNSESPAQSTCILDSPLGEDKWFPWIPESNIYPTNPPSLPFDALEFSTSSLPPSSPLPSSTTHESLLSLRQASHRAKAAETTLLDSDEVALPSTTSSSCKVDPFSRYGSSRHVTPDLDLASASPIRHLPRSGLAHIVPTLLDSYSFKLDLIPDLLTRDDPWNVIGDMLDLPPIPSADATYFNGIRSHHTGLSHELVSSPASSSSLGQVRIGESSCTTRDEVTRLRVVHSDGDILYCPDLWGVGNSQKTSRRATSLLLTRSSPKKAVSPARPFRSIHESYAQSPIPSHSAKSGNSPVVTEAPQSLLEPQTPPVLSPGPQRGISGMDSGEGYPALEKMLSRSPCIPTQRSTPPSPKNLNSLKESVSRSPGTLLSQWNEITEYVPVGLVPELSPTQTTQTTAQRPKLEFPDLFKDEEDGLVGVF